MRSLTKEFHYDSIMNDTAPAFKGSAPHQDQDTYTRCWELYMATIKSVNCSTNADNIQGHLNFAQHKINERIDSMLTQVEKNNSGSMLRIEVLGCFFRFSAFCNRDTKLTMERLYEVLLESELGEKESISSRGKKTIVFILGQQEREHQCTKD